MGLRPNLLPCALARKPRPHPLLDHRSLELGEDAHHLEWRLPGGRGGVDALLMQEQVDAEGVDLRQEAHKVCPLAALGREVARSGGETKAAATEVLEKLLVTLADSQSRPEARGDAIVALATMIGAMTMARIVSDNLFVR
jgi:hypothetical protein